MEVDSDLAGGAQLVEELADALLELAARRADRIGVDGHDDRGRAEQPPWGQSVASPAEPIVTVLDGGTSTPVRSNTAPPWPVATDGVSPGALPRLTITAASTPTAMRPTTSAATAMVRWARLPLPAWRAARRRWPWPVRDGRCLRRVVGWAWHSFQVGLPARGRLDDEAERRIERAPGARPAHQQPRDGGEREIAGDLPRVLREVGLGGPAAAEAAAVDGEATRPGRGDPDREPDHQEPDGS